MTALGIRSNNPLNIRYNPANKWIGQSEPNNGFCTFASPVDGIRAAAILIQNHYDKRGAASIRAIVSIWAPAQENDVGSYVESVCQRSGFADDDVLDFHTYEHVRPVLAAMIWHENGSQPYTAAQIDAGLARAGIVPTMSPTLQASRTVKGAQIAGGATIAGMGLETLRGASEAVDQFSGLWPLVNMLVRYAPWLLGGLALAGVGYVVYARWDDRRKGLR